MGRIVHTAAAPICLSNTDKKRAATILSFHALGWLAGISAAGIASDLRKMTKSKVGLNVLSGL